MSELNTEDEMLVVPREGPHRRRRLLITIGVGLFAVVALYQLAAMQIPYYSFSPGSATPTEDLVEVEGVPVYTADGEFFFTTVSSSRLTVFEWILAQFEDGVDIVHENVVLGDRTPSERRAQNQALMATSQETASAVALEHLGVEVIQGSGAFVTDVEPGSPADGVIEVDDVIIGLDGVDIDLSDELVSAVRASEPGTEVEVTVLPDGGEGEPETRTMVLGELDGRTYMGVRIGTYELNLADTPVDIDIDAGNVGGPSAGLAWTLTILDVLTPGELNGGTEVAVTGTIGLDGTVGNVGGVTQKTHAVRQAGIHVFLVPEGNMEEALRAAGDDLVIVGIEDLDDALDELAQIGGQTEDLAAPGLAELASPASPTLQGQES